MLGRSHGCGGASMLGRSHPADRFSTDRQQQQQQQQHERQRRRLTALSSHLSAPACTQLARAAAAPSRATPSAASAPLDADPPALFAAVARGITADLAAHSLPSLAVAVARDGEVLWEQGFGWADREAQRPATAHTSYSLASISKPITATGLAVLVERGLIDLDAPIDTYLGPAKLHPGAAGADAAGATVRRVANHTSGLPLHYQFFYEDELDRHPRPPFEETILRYGSLVTPPGRHYQYSNLGYGMLDHVISRASGGQSYADFMQQEVFLPLGLTRTSIDIRPGMEQHTATRYAKNGKRIPFYTFDHPGGSAVFSSAHDLLCFGMSHLPAAHPTAASRHSRRILSAETAAAMQVDTTAGANPDGGYGLGWAVAEARIAVGETAIWLAAPHPHTRVEAPDAKGGGGYVIKMTVSPTARRETVRRRQQQREHHRPPRGPTGGRRSYHTLAGWVASRRR